MSQKGTGELVESGQVFTSDGMFAPPAPPETTNGLVLPQRGTPYNPPLEQAAQRTPVNPRLAVQQWWNEHGVHAGTIGKNTPYLMIKHDAPIPEGTLYDQIKRFFGVAGISDGEVLFERLAQPPESLWARPDSEAPAQD